MHDESKSLVKIIPAVLPHTWAELERGVERLRGLSPAVQVDVVKDIFGGREAMPLWEETDYEFDIYIEPAAFVPRAVELGAAAVVVHARHATARAALEALQPHRGGDYPIRAGIALRPADTAAALAPFEGLFDYVQVMGIDNEGRQGEPFDPRATQLVRALRAERAGLYIQVDGHAAGHERELAAAGASALVVGSAVLRADNPRAAIKEIYTKANAQ